MAERSTGRRAEARREDLAVVGEHLLGGAVAAHGGEEGLADGLAVARRECAQTQKREWSSIPVV